MKKVLVLFFIFSFLGCAALKEGAKGIVGTSTKALEGARQDAIKKSFDYELGVCYDTVKEILLRNLAYVYAQDKKKGMLAIYISESDTTAVGIFFTRVDGDTTEIEVSSLSTYAKEFISDMVFTALENRKKIGATAKDKEKTGKIK